MAQKVEIYHSQDPSWNRFFDCVTPDTTEFQRIENRELISTFEADGDDIFEPRNVIFWLYFETENGRDVALAALNNLAFEVYDSGSDEGTDRPYSLGLQRVQPLDYFSVDEPPRNTGHIRSENVLKV